MTGKQNETLPEERPSRYVGTGSCACPRRAAPPEKRAQSGKGPPRLSPCAPRGGPWGPASESDFPGCWNVSILLCPVLPGKVSFALGGGTVIHSLIPVEYPWGGTLGTASRPMGTALRETRGDTRTAPPHTETHHTRVHTPHSIHTTCTPRCQKDPLSSAQEENKSNQQHGGGRPMRERLPKPPSVRPNWNVAHRYGETETAALKLFFL